MEFLGQLSDGFTGADLTELCQRATKAAIRESIEADAQKIALMKEAGDDAMVDQEEAVAMITRKHFEEALAAARRSVTDYVSKDIFTTFRTLTSSSSSEGSTIQLTQLVKTPKSLPELTGQRITLRSSRLLKTKMTSTHECSLSLIIFHLQLYY